MRSVSKKTGVSKKVVRDRRILAKARREDGGKADVSEGIRRAAEKIGATPSESAKAPHDANGMGPEEWAAAIEHAEKLGGPLHAELVRLARRFDDGTGVGHGLATSLAVVGLAGRAARTSLEVQLVASRWLADLAGTVADSRLSHAEGAT